jgi:hypothetical protein
MSDEIDIHKVKELKEMLQQRKPNEPAEKILAIFCERHAISMNTCHIFYKQLVEKGEIKEK